MVNWLRSQRFRVILLLNHDRLSGERELGLHKMVDGVHFIGDGYDGALTPIAAKRGLSSKLLEKLSLALPYSPLYKVVFGLTKAQKAQSDRVKQYLGSARLVQITRHLCDRYRPVAVIAEYVFAAPCLDVVPDGVLRIIDTIDVFSRKQKQVLAYGIEDPLPCTESEERNYLLKSDLVIAIQPNEARVLSRLAGNRDVITIGIDFDVVSEVDDSGIIRGTVLVVGSDNPLNRHGLNEFYRRVWPTIRGQRPDAILRVVGKVAHYLKTDDRSVQCIGWVSRLEDEYRSAEIVINPTVAGTGLKVKSVEALCHAKALVGTPNSVEGIETHENPPYVVCRDWSTFADEILRLLASDTERRRLQQLAWRFAQKHFSTESIYAPLARKLRPTPTPSHDPSIP